MIGQYEQLKADIAEVIRENGRQEITGDILQQVLLGMVGELGGGATFAGIAEPQPRAEALTPDNDVFYFVFDKGTYGQFGGIEVTDIGIFGVVYIKDGEWTLATYGEQEVRVTYGELMTLLQSARLTSGKVYRITDYATVLTSDITTAQSAGHVFDVLVTAVAENALSEDARAIHHDGDTYFGGSQLKSWALKYSLFNDTTRFGWADELNGKGVIYFMRDEFGNECGYDFKNIQFKRWSVTDSVEGVVPEYLMLLHGLYDGGALIVSGALSGNNMVSIIGATGSAGVQSILIWVGVYLVLTLFLLRKEKIQPLLLRLHDIIPSHIHYRSSLW